VTRAAVCGAGGYTGAEVVRLLVGHPAVDLVSVHASSESAGVAIAERAPELRGVCDLTLAPVDGDIDAEVVFLATPHAVSAELAPVLLARGRRVVDLSGAYRFASAAQVKQVYGFDLPEPGLLDERVYGLPEVVAADWAGARLVACAGCYVTAASVPLAACVRAGVVDTGETVLVDAISGVSGAGRGAALSSSFCEVSASPYKVMGHRHEPEIAMASGADVLFTPTLGPWKRGILATVHARLARGTSGADVRAALVDAYADEPFVRVLPAGVWPSVSAVERTNFVDVACAVDEERGRVVLFGALDNLLKGASGQAVQCMNLMLGLDAGAGLVPAAGGAVVL
jgi:N-acetyl-gamma-glutamyl-phosphate reductase